MSKHNITHIDGICDICGRPIHNNNVWDFPVLGIKGHLRCCVMCEHVVEVRLEEISNNNNDKENGDEKL